MFKFCPLPKKKKLNPKSHVQYNIMSSENQQLPLMEIPGDYGLPFFGAVKDRWDYFYNQGMEEFFNSRVKKYNSTVFRTNMPPGPFLASDPKVVVLLDAVSFPILFDDSRVEKKDVLDGTYMPSTRLFGGYRPCAFLDPSEPQHAALKGLFMSRLAKLHNSFIPIFRNSVTELFDGIEKGMAKEGKADFNSLSDGFSFDYVFRLFCDGNNGKSKLPGSSGPKSFDKWLFFQLAPLMTLGLKFVPKFLDDLILHTFPLPAGLAKSDYKKLYDAFYESGTSFLDEAEKNYGIKRDEACHNLVFVAGFNAYGGMKILFPALMKWVGLAGKDLHRRLAEEIRSVVKEEGGKVTLSALEKMSLTKSVAYEALRIEPPVPFQYGKAKEDIIISSHEASFQVKKGETIFGYQPFATKDPKIFERAEEFVPDRFVGEEGEKLLKYVYWSNGRETENPKVGNKQCPGKQLVVMLNRLMLVEFFLKYDSFAIEASTIMLGPSVTFTSLTKAK